jgi:hypothetical protein
MADIFISYSKARSVEAAELASELADLGYDVWWDTSLLPTGSFGAEIDRQLDAANAVIVIWSPESLRSKWVRSEASHGDRQDKLINTHTADPGVVASIPKPLDLIHSVGVENIRVIVGALDRLSVPRSKGTTLPPPEVAVPISAADADYRLFAEVEKAGTAEAYQFYLDEFPRGAHAPVARFKMRSLNNEAETAVRAILLANEKHLVDTQARRWAEQDARYRAEGRVPVGIGDGGIEDRIAWLKEGAGEAFRDLDIGPEMVVVPAVGAITASFAIGRFALMFDEWDAAQAHPDWQRLSGIAPRKPEDGGWGRSNQPAINVSWEDAKAYCRWLSAVTAKSYRLPGEAEWEHACRAGTTTEFWWGNEISTAQANYDGNQAFGNGIKGEYRKRTLAVDSFEANPWGLYQVHGNVWEWCEDPYDESSRVLRGGSWSYDPDDLRSAIRLGYRPTLRNLNIGFRIARTL